MNKHNFIPQLIIPLTSGYVIWVLNNWGLAFIWQSLHFTRKYGGEQMLWSHPVQIENSLKQVQL